MKNINLSIYLPRCKALLAFGVCIIASLCWMHVSQPQPPHENLWDLGHWLIPPLNKILGSKAALWLWWLGSMSINLFVVWVLWEVVAYGKRKKLLVGFGLVAFLHGILWNLTFLPVPTDILWRFPITTGEVAMPYDFWPSGHIGYALLFAFYSTQHFRWHYAVLSWCYAFFMIFLVLATRVHYSIDVAGAFFMAYAIYRLCEKLRFN